MSPKKKPDSRLRLSLGRVRVAIDIPPEGQGAALPLPDWLPFSHTELRIVGLLVTRQALAREQIATALDESSDGRIRGILAGLVSRKVLLVTTDGYQLNAPAVARGMLKSWLAEQERGSEGGGENSGERH